MKRLYCLLLALAAVLCACGAQPPMSEAQPEPVSETEQQVTSESDEPEPSFQPDEQPEPQEQAAAPAPQSPAAGSAPIVGGDKEQFVQRMLKAHPDAEESELRAGIDEQYDEHVSKGERVAMGPITYQEPMDYFKREGAQRELAVDYEYALDESVKFRLSVERRSNIQPLYTEAVEALDAEKLDKLFEGVDQSDYQAKFITVNDFRGVEMVVQEKESPHLFYLLILDDDYCFVIESEAVNQKIMGDARGIAENIEYIG